MSKTPTAKTKRKICGIVALVVAGVALIIVAVILLLPKPSSSSKLVIITYQDNIAGSKYAGEETYDAKVGTKISLKADMCTDKVDIEILSVGSTGLRIKVNNSEQTVKKEETWLIGYQQQCFDAGSIYAAKYVP